LPGQPRSLSGEEQRLLGELREHEIELERRNEELRATQARLEASRERSFDLYDLAPVGYVTLGEEGLIQGANLTVATMLGVERAALAGQPLTRFILNEDQEVCYLHRTQLLETGAPGSCEVRLLRQDGSHFWARIQATVAQEPDGGRVCRAVLSDIDERKRGDEALGRALATQEAIFEGSRDAVFISDADSRFVAVNAAACELTGYSAEELLTRRIPDLHDEIDLHAYTAHHDSIMAGADVLSEAPTLRKDGRKVETEFSNRRFLLEGKPFMHTTARDITERKRAEETQRNREHQWRLLVDTIPDFVALYDRDKKYIFLNHFAGGFTAEDLVDKSYSDFLSVETGRAYDAAFERAHQTGVPQLVEHAAAGGFGVPRFYESTIVPIPDEGQPAITMVLARDITARKQAEADLEHSRTQLLQAQKMEAVGRLAGGVAHDFNNLMQAMLSLATVLQLRAGTPEVTRIVAEIEALIKRGAGLTQQLLLFSRRQMAERKRLNLGELVGAAVVLLRRLIPENIRLTLDTTPEPLWVKGDEGQLQQVLMNLVVNARDAMPSGGTLTVRAGVGVDLGEVVVEVTDSGHGMDEETRSHVFEPFFTTKGVGQGTGLGLSVVHGIVAQHGGRIGVESAPGEGSRFRITLPAVPAPEGATGEVGPKTEMPRGHGERVLIVEDEEGARKGLTELLTMLGYKVTAVGSGEEAGVLPEELAPEALLTDLMLPGIDGASLASGLRERWPGIAVVLMSGYTADDTVRRGVVEGSVDFLQKPFDMSTLARAIAAALQTRLEGASR
jgi:two-component system cell cycle sensor histidine kinase/response regulator CckA